MQPAMQSPIRMNDFHVAESAWECHRWRHHAVIATLATDFPETT